MRIVIVDDSSFFRRSIEKALSEDDRIQIVGKGVDGGHGLELVRDLKPDVLVSDVEMPILNGIEMIREVRKFDSKVKVLVFSSLSQEGAKVTLQALLAGANDFLPKQMDSGDDPVAALAKTLIPKVIQFLSVPKEKVLPVRETTIPSTRPFQLQPDAVLIASSTGGPEALRTVFGQLSEEIDIPILIAQHMPPFFTNELSKMLDRGSKLSVKEGEENEKIEPGKCYVAPGDFHMRVVKSGSEISLKMDQGEKINFVRPAADRLFESAEPIFKGQCLVVVLTGMGCDGAEGVKKLKVQGAHVIIQDQESSTVWGMPGAVFREGAYDEILPLEKIGRRINEFCVSSVKKRSA